MISNQFIGVDVAKHKFDICFFKEDGKVLQKTFNNRESGFKDFVQWLNKQANSPWVCMEATGYYSEILADFLVAQGIQVSVVNPVQIKYFGKVKLSRNKNDIVDSKIIAEYAKVMRPRLFKSRTAEQKSLREIIQLEDTLKNQRTQLKQQWDCAQSSAIKDEYKKIIKLLDERLKELAALIKETIEKDEKMRHLVNLLVSIKGVGLLSVYRLLAYLPDINLFKNAKQLAAYIGVSPKQKESGKYVGKTKLSKLGNPKLRNILYMPALCAKRFNEAFKPFVDRLQKNGLSPKAIVGAVMRKLVHIIFGMLKNNSTFNADLV
jgi:transposase